MRKLLVLVVWLSACSEETAPKIVSRWRYEAPALVAAPGVGPEDRVFVMIRESAPGAGGQLATRSENAGLPIEGPVPVAALSAQPPLAVGSLVYTVTPIGKVVAYDWGGAEKFAVPSSSGFGRTTPIALAPDGSLRVATTAGQLLAIDGQTGEIRWQATIEIGADSPVAIDRNGTAYVATDGRVRGFDSSGAQVFDGRTGPLTSGPSVVSGGVVVGDADGVIRFDASGQQLWKHPRAARVVGTLALETDEVIAWGDDGIVERLGPDGDVRMRWVGSAATPPPVRANVVRFANGRLAILDDSGGAHTVGEDGRELVTVELGAAPLPHAALGDNGFVFVAVGKEIRALDFNAE